MTPQQTLNKNEKEGLIKIFQFLHPILVPSSLLTFNKVNCRSVGSAGDTAEHCDKLFEMAASDNSCLFDCLFALTTGKSANTFSNRVPGGLNLKQKKKMIESFAIADLVRNHSDQNGRGALKDFVGKQLMVNSAPQALYRILNYIGVSTSNEMVRVDAIKDCKEKILDGYSFEGKKYDLFLILFDNLGFRIRKGKTSKVGYEQYTAIEIVNVPKIQLIEWGIYPNKEKNIPGT